MTKLMEKEYAKFRRTITNTNSILKFCYQNRRTGSTTLIESLKDRCTIIVSNEKEVAKKVHRVSVMELHKMDGMKKKPFVFDNHVVMEICESFVDAGYILEKEISLRETEEMKVKKLEKTLSKIPFWIRFLFKITIKP